MLSFENENDRLSFSRYYTATVEIKDFNALINGKNFFDIPMKNKEEAYKKIVAMDDNCTAGDLLDYDYFSNHYRLFPIDLSRQIESDERQQLNFIGRLKRNTEAKVFFILKNQNKQLLIFHKIFLALYKMESQKIINLPNDSNNHPSKFATKK